VRLNSHVPPESSLSGINVYTYSVTVCPCLARPLCSFSEGPAATFTFAELQEKRAQVNRQDAPNVIRVSVLHCTTGYVAARPLRYRPRIFRDCPGGGINVSISQGKHMLPHRNDVRSRVTPTRTRASHSAGPGGHLAPGDRRQLLSRQAASPSLSCSGRARCRFASSCGSDIANYPRPVSSAALGDAPDGAPAQRGCCGVRTPWAWQAHRAVFMNPGSAARPGTARQRRLGGLPSRGPRQRERRHSDA
jgi:hypothetical protein